MPLSDDDLKTISARAARLDDRLAGAVQVAPGVDYALVEARLQRWCRALRITQFGTELGHRAGRSVLAASDVADVLGPVCWPSEQPLPGWAGDLAALVEAVEAASVIGAREQLDARREGGGRPEFPFEHALEPFVRVSQQRLRERDPANCLAQLAPSARNDLADELLGQLTWLWAPTLEVEFSIFRVTARLGTGGMPELQAVAGAASGRRHYLRFIQRLFEGGLAPLFREYAVLGRLTANVIAQWLETTTEFLMRLAGDRARLMGDFLPPSAGLVMRIASQLSDRHNGGRSVKALTFADGHRLIYKPRDLSIESAFAALLHWLQDRGLPLRLLTPRLVNGETHGWVEFIAHSPCSDEPAVRNYYFRAGELLALLHVLGANDLHYENLVAHGEYPVAIDLETVMHPRLLASPATRVPGLMLDDLTGQTVLRVGLLPSARVLGDQLDFDISGLGGIVDQDTPFHDIIWEHINTDCMVSRVGRTRLGAQANRPFEEGQPVAREVDAEAITEGFRAMAALLVTERDALLAADGPIAPLAAAAGRFVFRVTQFYAQLLNHLRKPEFLREGVERSLAMELLAAGLTGPDSFGNGRLAPLVRHEQQAIENLDIPRFSMAGNCSHLPLSDGIRLEGFFTPPALARKFHTLLAGGATECPDIYSAVDGWRDFRAYYKTARRFCLSPHALKAAAKTPTHRPSDSRESQSECEKCGLERTRVTLRAFDKRAVDLQANLIRAAVFSRGAERIADPAPPQDVAPPPDVAPPLRFSSTRLLGPGDALEEARSVGSMIAAHSLSAPGCGKNWLTFEAGLNGYGIRPAGIGLYDGAAGIALFLAALSHHGGETSAGDLARAALVAPLRALSDWDAAGPLPGDGEAHALGGLLYALVRCAEWLEQPSLLEAAAKTVAAITSAHIAADRHFDVIAGVAGLIPGLLAVHRATGERAALARAIDCGHHLIQHRQPGQTGGHAWPTLDGKMLTGFAHGAAGIACQLARLAQAGAGAGFLAAARDAITYEQSLFDSKIGNWPDLRAPSPNLPAFSCSWCHGAPGIALSRAAWVSAFGEAELLPQIEAGLQTTLRFGSDEVDSLCCGNAGRIDILVSLAARLGRPALLERAQHLAAAALAKKIAAGDWRYLWQLPRGVFHPTLFQGAAGIGYTLLRLALPGRLPSILLME